MKKLLEELKKNFTSSDSEKELRILQNFGAKGKQLIVYFTSNKFLLSIWIRKSRNQKITKVLFTFIFDKYEMYYEEKNFDLKKSNNLNFEFTLILLLKIINNIA